MWMFYTSEIYVMASIDLQQVFLFIPVIADPLLSVVVGFKTNAWSRHKKFKHSRAGIAFVAPFFLLPSWLFKWISRSVPEHS